MSETLSTAGCDCKSQLRHAMAYLSGNGGHLLYLHDEGRGYLGEQVHGERAADTDPRDFVLAADVIASVVGTQQVKLLTNNPRKLAAFASAGINLAGRISLVVPETARARRYLEEKMQVLGHLPERDPAIRVEQKLGTPNRTLVELHTPDFAPVRLFYTSLGFKVAWERPPDQKKGYLVMAMAGNILCFWAGNEYVYEHSYLRRFPRPTPRGYGTEIVLTVADLQDYYDRFPYRSRIVAPLRKRDWGFPISG